MKIAQVAPLYESVPPKMYGGTGRIVAYLTDELVSQGHDVTLFASGDSISLGNLVPIIPKALRLENTSDSLIYNVLQLQQVLEWPVPFDIIHYPYGLPSLSQQQPKQGSSRHHPPWQIGY